MSFVIFEHNKKIKFKLEKRTVENKFKGDKFETTTTKYYFTSNNKLNGPFYKIVNCLLSKWDGNFSYQATCFCRKRVGKLVVSRGRSICLLCTKITNNK